ncbi:hypothetical protein LEP1GSC103_0835 [Leptospira borgpetersenii serovar Javanica str. UI 09931]|uniref:Uncharacterized protein n=3 Tax=Leptospira borgpetersenii TaxID=174 RepID=A0A0S2IX46_LEPBO|nr:hypothetical protein LBBP_04104 [Leptospira borgpetersenii serovar Ballum]EKP11790.1 hypothetical protein LEP1GSC128_1167 [Leptospira borgpetersenii str. 200801926]EKQ91520.1 hypothetical protein LEP1GSC101_1003 [Leptospira borgpetersenii str. UI 09149]EKR00942.1 hypothetical protein LEP1GSC121_1549 [Leptospira borgpetersenii serovar Castellonis str. 200801910]EMK08398.1 hypothetical protein LEP1GSC066_1018 [Leptospira sp. serovar Kenya str. Sh9]EMN57469.1 hypothetical protein LEP1GSC090_25
MSVFMNNELFSVVGFEFSNREPLAWSRLFYFDFYLSFLLMQR